MIIGANIQLLPLNEECFDLTLKWVNNPELRYFTGSRFPVSKYEHEVWFKARAIDKYNKTYAIQIKDTNQIIGLIGNNDYEPIHRTTKTFIYIGETDYKQKGIGQEALRLFLDFCFNELNMHKVYCFIYNYNTVSRYIHEKCGYVLEGILKEHWFKNGKYHDVLVMGRVNDYEQK